MKKFHGRESTTYYAILTEIIKKYIVVKNSIPIKK